MIRRPRTYAFLAISAILLTGCTSSGTTSQEDASGEGDTAVVKLDPLAGGEPPLDQSIVAAADPTTVSMPLMAHAMGDAKIRLVNRARIVVGDKCMSEFGISQTPGWNAEGAIPANPYAKYGVWDEKSAAAFGYDSPPVTEDDPDFFRFGADGQSVWWGQVDTYQGRPVPEGGCAAREVEAVMGDFTFEMVDGNGRVDLEKEALTRATQDSRVAPLLDAWRSCMKEAGWDYADPQAPFGYWHDKRGSNKHQAVISDEEKRSAVTDVECKKSTGLLGTWIAAEVAYQKVLIERDWETLRVYKQNLDALVKRANKVLAEAGQHP